MRRAFLLLLIVLLVSCEEIFDVKVVDGPCTIELVDGSTIIPEGSIEILQSTGTLTYKDQDGKLWALTSEEYASYSCGA